MRFLYVACLLAAVMATGEARETNKSVTLDVAPRPRPALKSDTPPEPPMDLSHAMPGSALGKLPSSSKQFGALKEELDRDRPKLAGAREQSDSLAKQASQLRAQLIAAAARIEELERQTIALDNDISALQAQDAALTEGFVRDRISVTRLLAILERLQHDMPPALAVRPDDALAAARGAMLVGASLPPVYAQAASLAARIDKLKTTRTQLVARRIQAASLSASLARAQAGLEILTTQKEQEAAGAASRYGDLKTRLDEIAAKAANFQALLTRIAQLRRAGPAGPQPDIVTVTARGGDAFGPLTKGSLLRPVVGTEVPGQEGAVNNGVVNNGDGPETAKNPGMTFITAPGAQVIAPADGKVLFAGSYHKSGQVLILEISTGYDLVLAGLGRVTVRPNDELLAGEPVGQMPNLSGTADSAAAKSERLYFELRQNIHALNPAPWLIQETRQTMRKAKRT